jgi:hypothetical protein
MGCGSSSGAAAHGSAPPSAEAPEAAIDAAGPAEAAALLGRHVGDAALAAAACDRIGYLAHEGEEDALGAAGAAGLLVDAMRAHPGHADLQYNGINALRHLVAEHAANRAAAVEAGAVEALVAALRAHPPGDPLDVLV